MLLMFWVVCIFFSGLFITQIAKADFYSVSDAATEINTANTAESTAENAQHAIDTLTQLNRQYDLLNEQLTSLQNAVKRLDNIGEYDSASQYINQINGIMNQLNGIYSQSKRIDKDFQTLYPGYQPSSTTLNTSSQYETMVNSSLNTLSNVVSSTTQVSNSLSGDKATLDTLEGQAKTAQGQTQAMQVGNQLLAQVSSQLQMMQQMLVSQTEGQSAYYAEQMQQQARTEADITSAIANGMTTAPQIGHSGSYVSLPTHLDY